MVIDDNDKESEKHFSIASSLNFSNTKGKSKVPTIVILGDSVVKKVYFNAIKLLERIVLNQISAYFKPFFSNLLTGFCKITKHKILC